MRDMMERPAAFGAFEWGAVVVSVLGVAASLCFTFLVMPSVAHAYRDFGGTLPLVTRLALSRRFVGSWMFLDASLIVAGVAQRSSGKRRAGRGLLGAGATVSALLVATLAIGTYLPLFTLADAIRE